ncbi:uncharacterized protein LOC143577608 [Bidens hawaiensis]|uniref:uncharacterized protein LOC143577608 n=1 Tax=Bidens hawaiensis TaxID=980011 RepID=UPI00404B8AEB
MGDCSVVVLNRVPEKLSDPGVFMITCLFGSDAMSHALAGLGASINLMSYSMYEKLELGELTTTRMSLLLADRSVKHPRGMDSCFNYICGADLVGSNGLVDCDDLGEDDSCENDSVCDELVEISGLPEMIEVNEISCESEAGSEEKPAPLELKVLPSHLEYAYLDEGSNLPVIVSSKLTKEGKSKLIDVLKLYKGPITSQSEYARGGEEGGIEVDGAGMIYPISDSPWVSPTQVVPKKGGITVMMNEKNELIPSRMVIGWRIPPPTNVKAIRSFLGHAGFYRRFIKDFSKITRPMTRLLEKDVPFVFYDECVKAFTFLKEKLVSAPILCSPNWSLPFELTCDASDYAVGAGMTMQQKMKFFRDVNRYVWDDPFLFKIGIDRILRRCVTKEEGWDILKHVHEGLTGGHHGAHATAQKVFDSGFYWLTVVKDAEEFVKLCDTCQRTGTTPFMLIYGKSCHLLVELEHRAYWALKTVNVDLTEDARKRYFQIHELEELRDAAYSRSLNIKEKTKALHDRRLKGGKEFKKGDKVLLFNSRLKLFAGKLRSKWTGPYLVKEVFPYGVVDLENPDNGTSWKVNGHRLIHYLGGPEEAIEMEETPLTPSH